MSTAQELIDQGMKQGEAKGARETLTRQLVAKFGRLDTATTRRLADGSLSDLARWTEQILSARRVDDVFAQSKAPRRGKRPRGR
jgi:hypothetical protein